MHKWIMFILVSVASLLAVGLLAFGLPEKPKPEVLPEGVTVMSIVASNDFTFNQEEFTAKVGDTVIMRFSNKSGIHSVAVDELNIMLDKNNPELEQVFTEPGEYVLYCDIPCGVGHATMTAKLIITA